MTTATQGAVNVRAILNKLSAMRQPPTRESFTFEFDGTETTQTLPTGWKPYAVFLDGSRQFLGAGDDCDVSFDGFRYSVVWSVAPSNTSACHIDAERQQ